MAEIPVERKQGGLPWWLIPLLLLLVLIPLLFLFSRGCADNTVGNTNNGNVNRAGASNINSSPANGTAVVTNNNAGNISAGGNAGSANSSALTDINYFAGISDKNTLAGRTVDFKNVEVDRVLSDHVFTVKSGASEIFVYLDESQDSGGGKEQAVKIRPNQKLNLSGDFRRVPNAETANEKNEKQAGGLTEKEYAQMKGQQVYLHGVSR